MTKNEYIQAVCEAVRSKSDCFKRKVGAVFVNEDYEILATGYNGPPKGFPHCDQFSEADTELKLLNHTCGNPCTRNIHAEQNAIAQAAKRGIALKESVLYCTYMPCINCARLLVNIGIEGVYYKEDNTDGGDEVLSEAGIPAIRWEDAN